MNRLMPRMPRPMAHAPRYPRLLASGVLLVTAAAMAAIGSPATAAMAAVHSGSPSGSTASSPKQISFSLITASGKGPDLRGRFTYSNIRPGTTITDHVAIVNHASASAYSLYGTDATGTTLKNVLTLLRPDQKPTDIGSWVHFGSNNASTTNLVMGASQAITEQFTINVPPNATPGDHTGAVVAALGLPRKNSKGQNVVIYERIALEIALRVVGPLNPGLRVESVSAGFRNSLNPFGNGAATVTYLVVNTGNVRMTGTQSVAVTGPFGMKSKVTPPPLPVILPGDSVRVTAAAPGLYPAGPMSAAVTVNPAIPPLLKSANEKVPPVSHDAASLFAVPWALVVVIMLLVGAGFGVRYFLRWRQRQQRALVEAAIARARTDTAKRILGARDKAEATGGKPDDKG